VRDLVYFLFTIFAWLTAGVLVLDLKRAR
jgi:ABC-2 type transport system permease protein